MGCVCGYLHFNLMDTDTNMIYNNHYDDNNIRLQHCIHMESELHATKKWRIYQLHADYCCSTSTSAEMKDGNTCSANSLWASDGL